MEPLYRILRDSGTTQPWRQRWVVMPSLDAGHTMAERLARDGHAWANLRFTTCMELAARIAKPALVESGRSLLEQNLGPALTLRLLLDLNPAVPKYFRNIAEQPGVADALWRALRDLRLAGLSSGDLDLSALCHVNKAEELLALLSSYEAFLRASALVDDADVLRTAAAAGEKFPVTTDAMTVRLANAQYSELERTFLAGLPGEHVMAESCGEGIPRVTSNAQLLSWVGRSGSAPDARTDESLTMFQAGGREAEVLEVLRRILRSHRSLDSMEVICPWQTEHAALFWEKARRIGVPVTIAAGIPAGSTRPFRAVFGFLQWIEGNFPAALLSRLFEAGVLSIGAADLSAGGAARLLRRSGASLSRGSYRQALGALAASSALRADDRELEPEQREYYGLRAANCRTLSHWIESLLAAVPSVEQPSVELRDVVGALRYFLGECTACASEEDGAARAAVATVLHTFEPLAGLRRPLQFHIALLRASLQDVRICQDRPEAGKLHVSTLGSPSYSGRDTTFVIGLEEGAFFSAETEDPVLLDAERKALAPGRLLLSQERTEARVDLALAQIRNVRGSVTLSYSCRDLRAGRHTYPSWMIFDAWKMLRRPESVKLDELTKFLGEPATVVPATMQHTLSNSEWWLSGSRGAGSTAREAVASLWPDVGRSYEADRHRNASEMTQWDGLAPTAGTDLDPRRPDRVQSASGLEQFVACPFRYFLEKALGVDPLRDEESDPDVWLDPLARGSLLHDIFRDFLRRLRRQDGKATASDWEQLWRIAGLHIERMKRAVPPLSESACAAAIEEIRNDLRLFLRLESRRNHSETLAVEAPFGFGENDPYEPLSLADPVSIALGDGEAIRLRGRIDRIDRLQDGSCEVIDYKTGRFYRPAYTGDFRGGALLQHAIYAEAARKMLRVGTPVSFASYWFCTERGHGELVRKPANLDVVPVLNDVADAIRSGAFIRGGMKDTCRNCDYGYACPQREVDRAGEKRESTQTELEPLGRLANHE